MAWLSGWENRVAVTLRNNRPVSITKWFYDLDLEELGIPDDYNYSDVRVTSSDGVTVLDLVVYIRHVYVGGSWQEKTTGRFTSQGALDAYVDDTVYIYWGNGSVPSGSDPDNVYDFFDNHNDNSVDTDKWEIYTDPDPDYVIVEEDDDVMVLRTDRDAIYPPESSGSHLYARGKVAFTDEADMHVAFKADSANIADYKISRFGLMAEADYETDGYHDGAFFKYDNDGDVWKVVCDNGVNIKETEITAVTPPTDEWGTFRIEYSQTSIKFYLGETLAYEETDTDYIYSGDLYPVYSAVNYIFNRQFDDKYDWIGVLDGDYSEVTYVGAGDEESAPADIVSASQYIFEIRHDANEIEPSADFPDSLLLRWAHKDILETILRLGAQANHWYLDFATFVVGSPTSEAMSAGWSHLAGANIVTNASGAYTGDYSGGILTIFESSSVYHVKIVSNTATSFTIKSRQGLSLPALTNATVFPSVSTEEGSIDLSSIKMFELPDPIVFVSGADGTVIPKAPSDIARGLKTWSHFSNECYWYKQGDLLYFVCGNSTAPPPIVYIAFFREPIEATALTHDMDFPIEFHTLAQDRTVARIFNKKGQDEKGNFRLRLLDYKYKVLNHANMNSWLIDKYFGEIYGHNRDME